MNIGAPGPSKTRKDRVAMILLTFAWDKTASGTVTSMKRVIVYEALSE